MFEIISIVISRYVLISHRKLKLIVASLIQEGRILFATAFVVALKAGKKSNYYLFFRWRKDDAD